MKKTFICALFTPLIASSAFAACTARIDVEGRFEVEAAAKMVNGEICKTYRADNGARFGADFDCPSLTKILTVWLDEDNSQNYASYGGYISRLLCRDEWTPGNTATSEKRAYDAHLAKIYGPEGHGDDIEEVHKDCVLDGDPDMGKPGVTVCE